MPAIVPPFKNSSLESRGSVDSIVFQGCGWGGLYVFVLFGPDSLTFSFSSDLAILS